MAQPIRIAVLHFSHETVTFLKNDTTLEDFIYPGSPAKGEALLNFDPAYFMGGFVKMAREFDAVELVAAVLVREETLLEPRDEDGMEFEPLGRMHRHELQRRAPFRGLRVARLE